MGRIAADSLLDLFVHDDIDLDSRLSFTLQDLVEPPIWVVEGRTTEKQLWAEPPVLDVDDLFRCLKGNADGVEVVAPIDIPLDLVSWSLRGE